MTAVRTMASGLVAAADRGGMICRRRPNVRSAVASNRFRDAIHAIVNGTGLVAWLIRIRSLLDVVCCGTYSTAGQSQECGRVLDTDL